MNTKLNKSDYWLIGIYFFISWLFTTTDYYFEGNAKTIEMIVDAPVQLVVTLFMLYIFMYYLIPKYLVENKNYWMFFSLSLLTLIALGGIDVLILQWTGGNQFGSMLKKPIHFIYKSIATASNNIALLFGILLTKKFYESQIAMVSMEEKRRENELKMLRSQIDPHFLFNNLNTLDALIDTDTQACKTYIQRLSKLYRYLIQTKDAEVMPLEEEMQWVQHYIYLIETRFKKDYQFHIAISQDLSGFYIPTGALQLALENVVKHNHATDNQYVEASIQFAADQICIRNNKTIKKNTDSLGTGLKNLKARYQLLSDKQIQIEENDHSFQICLPLLTLSTDS